MGVSHGDEASQTVENNGFRFSYHLKVGRKRKHFLIFFAADLRQEYGDQTRPIKMPYALLIVFIIANTACFVKTDRRLVPSSALAPTK